MKVRIEGGTVYIRAETKRERDKLTSYNRAFNRGRVHVLLLGAGMTLNGEHLIDSLGFDSCRLEDMPYKRILSALFAKLTGKFS